MLGGTVPFLLKKLGNERRVIVNLVVGDAYAKTTAFIGYFDRHVSIWVRACCYGEHEDAKSDAKSNSNANPDANAYSGAAGSQDRWNTDASVQTMGNDSRPGSRRRHSYLARAMSGI